MERARLPMESTVCSPPGRTEVTERVEEGERGRRGGVGLEIR